MTEADESPTDRPAIEGMHVDEATEALLAAEPQFEERTVRGILATVAEYGDGDEARLTWDAVEGKLANLSKVVSTPETRIELAEVELESALEAAGEERRRPVVKSRLGGHAERLNRIQREVNDLSRQLQRLTATDEDLFAVAYGIVQLDRQANDMQARADDLQLELEAFGTWVSNPRTRFDELDGDLNALAETLEGTEQGVDQLERAIETGDTDPLEVEDPALAWLGATFTHRVLELLLSDLEWEFDALRAWSEEDGDDVSERVDELETRLAEFDESVAAFGVRIESLGRDGWAEQFADERAAFAADLDDEEPPVDWGAVQATLTEHRKRLREA